MNRVAALATLTKFTPLATSAGLTITDNAANLGPVIDNALRALGFTEAQLVDANPDVELNAAYIALLDYYTLDLFALRFISFVDVSVGGGQGYAKKKSQLFDHLMKMRDEARVRVQDLGDSVGGSDFVFGEINVGYIEPLDEAEL